MITYWFDNEKPLEFEYRLKPDEGALIYKLLGSLSLNDLKDRGFSDEEIEEIHKLYYSF